MTIKITSSNVAVAADHMLQPMSDCPLGCKVQLLTPGSILVYGSVTEKTRQDYLAWFPLPRKPEWLNELLSKKVT